MSPIYPTDYTQEDYAHDVRELQREDAMKEEDQEEEIEQAVNERTLEDAGTHLRTAVISYTSGCTEEFHEALIKAYNTVHYLLDNPNRQHKEFTQADVQAAWRDGYEAAKEEEGLYNPAIPEDKMRRDTE